MPARSANEIEAGPRSIRPQTGDYYLAVRPFGDSLISLSLLNRLPGQISRVHILGTPVTQQVAAATGLTRFPIRPALPGIAAFFDIRVRGVRHALDDLRRIRRHLADHTRPGDVLLVEQRDWRNRLLIPAGHAAVVEPARTVSVYVDRSALIESHFGARLTLPTCRRPSSRPYTVVIHPGARQPGRTFPQDMVESLMDYAKVKGLSVRLIDPDSSYSIFRQRAETYLPAPTLDEAIACLRASDLFIGADSFFLHLAYFYGIPLFGIGETARPYFSPPGMVEQGCSSTLQAACDRRTLFSALDRALC